MTKTGVLIYKSIYRYDGLLFQLPILKYHRHVFPKFIVGWGNIVGRGGVIKRKISYGFLWMDS